MSWDFNKVTEIRPVRDFVLYIAFDDGLSGELDFGSYVNRGPIFQPLAEEAFFRRAHIAGGTVAWPNGADIAPERLYEMLEAKLPQGIRR
jgi:hypothetical protein